MKRIIIIATILTTCFISESCTKDFLTEKPVDEIYANNLLVNYRGFYSMISAQRGLMRNEHGRFDATAISPNSVFNGGSDLYFGNQRISTATWWNWPKLITQFTDGVVFKEIFDQMYTIINVSNMIINRAENDPNVDWEGGSAEKDEINKTSIIAQAKFFRAWAYRHLTYSFGDVPLSLEEITGSNYRTDWDRDPVEKVREAMIADFQYCVDHLDWRTDGNNTKPNQAIARTYLAETYLAIDKVQEASEVLKPLCEGDKYSLMTTRFGSNASEPGNCFIDVFRSPLYSEGNKEVLYSFLNAEEESIPYGTTGISEVRNMFKNYYSYLTEVATLTHPDYEGKTIDLFWSLNGGKGASRLAVPIGAWRLYEWGNQQDNDIRYDEYSVMKKLYFLNTKNEVYEILDKDGNSPIALKPTAAMFATSEGTIKNYFLPSTRKWDNLHSNFERASTDYCFQNVSYMRLSESYFLYAEALHKLGDNEGAAKWINKIRSRAQVSTVTSSDITMDFILDERARELLCEGQRRHTLMRVSQANGGDERDVNNYFKRRIREINEVCGQIEGGISMLGTTTVSHGAELYDTPVLFPIPKVFIDSNTKIRIKQNEGYPSY